MNDLNLEERILFGNRELAHQIGQRCRQLNESPDKTLDPLSDVITSLMTEFWDQGFSQTEIRDAFNTALSGMNRYAAGEERRDSGIAVLATKNADNLVSKPE